MNFKGQGALEYLLMIGGGLAVAAIVLVFLFSGIGSQTCQNAKRQLESLCNANPTEGSCLSTTTGDVSVDFTGVDCQWDTPVGGSPKCIAKTSLNWSGVASCPT